MTTGDTILIVFTIIVLYLTETDEGQRLRERLTAPPPAVETCPACTCTAEADDLRAIRRTDTLTPPEILEAMALIESGGRHTVILRGAHGERGMLQITPEAAAYYGCSDYESAGGNVQCADIIMQAHMQRSGGDLAAALCRYNGAKAPCPYADKVIKTLEKRG